MGRSIYILAVIVTMEWMPWKHDVGDELVVNWIGNVHEVAIMNDTGNGG
jgi:hypothetical protein